MAKLATFQLLDEEWIGKCTLFLHDVILADQWKFNFFKKKKKKKKKKCWKFYQIFRSRMSADIFRI